eukprot:COSAG02_NODE_60770_length_270_cov_0.883041_1_plen_42_part_01
MIYDLHDARRPHPDSSALPAEQPVHPKGSVGPPTPTMGSECF